MKRSGWWCIGASILAFSSMSCAAAKPNKNGNTSSSPAGGGSGAGNNPGTSSGSGATGDSGGGSGKSGGGSGGSGMMQASGAGGSTGSSGGKGGSSGGKGGKGGSAGSDAMDPMETLDPAVDWTALTLVFDKMYSAFDGQHTFQIPVHVDGATVDLADWQAIPSDAVTFEADPDGGGAMITIVKGVEDITIAAHTQKLGGTAPLKVTLATPADWDVGQKRYNNGVDYMLPDLNFADLIDPNWMPPPTPKNLACNNCHSTGAKYFEIQHTPTQIGNYSDETLITIFTTGMKPAGVPYHVLPMDLQHLYPEFHTWDATDAERKGLIVYLRSLTPVGQGTISVPDGGISGVPMM